MAATESSNSRLRIYGPDNLGIGDDEDSVDSELDGGIREELLAKIHRCYGRVELIAIGFCFGLLDPVCNIVVGQAIACADKFILQKAELELQDEPSWRPTTIRCVDERSLNGLVAFLVALFPYLTNYRAMWYLNLADADPLVAARLVIRHRGMEGTFGFASGATVAAVETALRCAATAAQHPNPNHFSLGWKLLSPSLQEVAAMTLNDPSQMINIMSLLRQPQLPPVVLSLEKSWELASCRLLNLGFSFEEEERKPIAPTTMRRSRILPAISCGLLKLNPPLAPAPEANTFPPAPRVTLKRVLLTTIHGYYLQALALLPKDKLRSHYHHSLLHAGHCYGPLDPVSNIIVNTIWYSKAYPLIMERKVKIQVISTKPLLRIAVRSLYGLVSFLCTRYPDLTPGEALRRLQLAGANLQKADDQSFLNHTASNRDDGAIIVPVEEAYAAAAKAAYHPKPLQQAQFLGPSNSILSAFSLLLKCEEPGKVRPLIVDYFQAVGSIPAQETKNISVLGPWDYSFVTRKVNGLWEQHNRAVRMVKSAIDMYNDQHRVPSKYELHVVCGVNEYVDGPVQFHTYRCSHINFLATRTAAGAGTPPELFFAECRNDGPGVVSCSPVAMPLPGTEQVRCLYCEMHGSRIVHPAAKEESFMGRDIEFVKMLGGEEVYSEELHTNNRIISCSHEKTWWVDYLKEDQIYCDYICDNNIVEERFPRVEFD